MAAGCHYSDALQSYRLAIDDESVQADALFACCMLLTLLSFKNLSSDQCINDVSTSQKSFALDTVGIRFIGGPRILEDAISRQSMIDQGIWKNLFRHCEKRFVESDDMFASSQRVSSYGRIGSGLSQRRNKWPLRNSTYIITPANAVLYLRQA
ncbi:hypothetical protein V500_03183 [Pseudogymnoascus sp. VKM F-4518 (FW-2643)]|nr:hypothetical protein V500_03183 [Pseudogymnoascus sp. VKM F-4518 (FW-2643)]